MRKIFEENKGKLLLSSLIIFLPFLFSVAAGKGIFYQSFFLLLIHWLCLLITLKDRKNSGQSRKALGMVFWLVPMLAMLRGALFFLMRDDTAGYSVMSAAMCFGIGLVFVFTGNYLPKVRQNSTLGIKVKWALENEENWNATHRFAGRVWVIAGFVCMACGLLPRRGLSMVLFPAAILLAAFLPCVYSWNYYGKQLKSGTADRIRQNPKAVIFSGILMAAVFAFVLWVLFTGNMEIIFEEQSFTIETKNWADLTVRYQDIEEVVYESDGLSGGGAEVRTNGFGNLRMSLGAFSNDRYGAYTRYTFTSCDACVELTVNGKIIVVNGADEEATKRIYDTVKRKIE